MLAFAVCALSARASVRDFYFSDADSQDGLYSHAVTALLQDRTGYLWIGTQGGLQRYDGYKYTYFGRDANAASALPENYITALTQDASGRLWVGSMNHGLVALDAITHNIVAASLIGADRADNPRNTISALAWDPKRGVWIGTAAGIELMGTSGDHRSELFRFAQGSGRQRVSDFALATDGALWSATSAGVLRVAAGATVAQPVGTDVLPVALSILPDADSGVYVGASDGLYHIDMQRRAQRVWPAAGAPPAANPVRAIVRDRNGRLWLSTFGAGLTIYNPADGSTQSLHYENGVPGSLPDDFVNRLLIDRSGLLWAGGQIDGIAVTEAAGTQFRYIVDPSSGRGQAGNSIRAILEDDSGRLWLGTDGDGLVRYDPAHDSFDYFDKPFKSAATHSDSETEWHVPGLASAGNGKLWVATNHGAYEFDPKARKATAVPVDPDGGQGLPGSSVRSVLADRDGSVWFGTAGQGLAHWWPATPGTPSHWEILRHRRGDAASLAHDLVLTLCQDSGGRVWIGTLNGLSVYNPAQRSLRSYQHDPNDPQSLGDNLVRSLHQSGDGALWIGTQSGLDRVDDPAATKFKAVHFSTKDGLPGATVLGILDDNDHNIWLSTNRGIAVYSRKMNAFLAFTAKDGLQGLEFNASASYRLRDGHMAFGGLHGLNLFDPDKIRHEIYAPPVAITGVSLGDTARLTPIGSNGVVMAQAQRLVHFEFAALDYRAPARNRFSYRLVGLDPRWVAADTRHSVTYTNLPAGDYRFEVRAANSAGIWSEADAVVPLRVIAPWWATRWMKALYAVLAVAALYALWLGYRRRRLRDLRYHRELHEREDRLRLALWGSGDEFWDWDTRTDILYRIGADQLVNGQLEESMSVDEWRRQCVHPDDLSAVEQRMEGHILGHTRFFESEHRIRTADDQWIWVLSRGKAVTRDANGTVLRVCGTARNVTAARAAERDRRVASEVIDCMSEAVAVVDPEFHFVSVNRAFTRTFGYQDADILATHASILNSHRQPAQHYLGMRKAVLESGHWRGELWQRRKDGEEFLSWMEVSQVRDDSGQRTHFVSVISDITERKRAEQELRYLANYDTLTGLPNRTLLGERLAHAVIHARRTLRKVAVLFLDLDRFKHVNDSMGHAIGDRVLKAVGERLRASVHEAATVARLGGDEFTVVLEDVQHADEPARVARHLLEVFSAPLTLDSGQQVVISPSIGISLYPDHAQVPTDLLKCADTAMYQAKESGRNMYAVYTETLDASVRRRAGILGGLRLALERDELHLVYQPMLDLVEGRISGVEALLRWNSPEFGEVGPTVFIPLAEEGGMIERIGEFVLLRACTQLREWQDRGLRDITMSVNLSALQLLRSELTQRLCEILAELQLEPGQLELELTESVLMANPELAIHTLDRLHALGVSISIDDFGTGYSSLSYLKRLPIDRLKIDRSFVGDITTDPDDEAITKTIITIAHSLGLDVIAEGVETVEQLEYLHEQGCDEIQGHWLSPPLPAVACFTFIREFVRSRPPRRPRLTPR